MVDFKDKRLEKVKVIVPLSTPLDDKGDFDSEGMKISGALYWGRN